MGTRPLLIALLLLVGPAVHPVPLAAQEAPKAGPNWSVEVFGGLAPVDPRDLNAWSLNREAVYGSSSTTTSGEFPLLDHGRTIGVRAAWHISRRIALAAGFDYLSGTTRSESIHREWETTSLNPDAVAFPSVGGLTSDFTEAFSVRSYEPWIGVRLAVWRHGPFSAEGIAQGGATRASVQLEETGAQTASPYMQRATWSHRMEGTGWHPSGEAGIRAGWEATRRLGAFIEISYKYRPRREGRGIRRSRGDTSGRRCHDRRVPDAHVRIWPMADVAVSSHGPGDRGQPALPGHRRRPEPGVRARPVRCSRPFRLRAAFRRADALRRTAAARAAFQAGFATQQTAAPPLTPAPPDAQNQARRNVPYRAGAPSEHVGS